jgi:hypothetical protein
VLVDPVVPDVDVVLLAVPLVVVPLVDVPPLPSALPLEVVALFVTGGPPPVSVAVVPDVPAVVGCSVSVDAARSSFGPRLHAVQRATMAMIVMTPRMRMGVPPQSCGAIVAPGWRAT